MSLWREVGTGKEFHGEAFTIQGRVSVKCRICDVEVFGITGVPDFPWTVGDTVDYMQAHRCIGGNDGED